MLARPLACSWRYASVQSACFSIHSRRAAVCKASLISMLPLLYRAKSDRVVFMNPWTADRNPFWSLAHEYALCVRLPAILPHRIAAHLDAVGVVNQPVEDAVRQCRVADLFVPPRDWQLRGQDRRAHLVAVFTDLPEVAALRFTQRCHGPIVDHQNVDSANPGQHIAETAIGARHSQVAE